MTKKHVYYDGNSEWIVAESKDEACSLLRSIVGYSDTEAEDYESEMAQLPDDKELGITVEDESAFEGMTDNEANDLLDADAGVGVRREVKTCGQWAEGNDKGMLCSSEC